MLQSDPPRFQNVIPEPKERPEGFRSRRIYCRSRSVRSARPLYRTDRLDYSSDRMETGRESGVYKLKRYA